MATVYLGLGSNLGDREKNILAALAALKKNQIEIVKLSSMIDTAPVGGPPQGPFLNAAVEIKTTHTPQELLRILQSIEKDLGRIRSVKDAPRTIDLDILLYDDLSICTDELTIPHPKMFERNFVLVPLQEIAPQIKPSRRHAAH